MRPRSSSELARLRSDLEDIRARVGALERIVEELRGLCRAQISRTADIQAELNRLRYVMRGPALASDRS
jgi:hypothetical protein